LFLGPVRTFSHPLWDPCRHRTFARTSVRRHPFSEAIIETPLPENWKNLTMDKYDRSMDPDEHIAV